MSKFIIATHNNTEHKLFIDEQFQPRDVGDFDTKAIHEYSQLLQDGIEFPELEAVCWITDDGKHIYYLCSGFHRAEGYLAASQVNPNIKPLMFKVVHSDSDWNTLMQQAVIYGTASNKAHGVRISKSSYRRAIRKLYESGMDTKGITEALGVNKSTVNRNTEDLRYEVNKQAVWCMCARLTIEPNCSLPKLQQACNNVFGKDSIRSLKALFNFAGESVCYQWLDAGRPTMSSGESIENFYKFITGNNTQDMQITTPSISEESQEDNTSTQVKEHTNNEQETNQTNALPKTPTVPQEIQVETTPLKTAQLKLVDVLTADPKIPERKLPKLFKDLNGPEIKTIRTLLLSYGTPAVLHWIHSDYRPKKLGESVHDFYKEMVEAIGYPNGFTERTDWNIEKFIEGITGKEYAYLQSHIDNQVIIMNKHALTQEQYVAVKQLIKQQLTPISNRLSRVDNDHQDTEIMVSTLRKENRSLKQQLTELQKKVEGFSVAPVELPAVVTKDTPWVTTDGTDLTALSHIQLIRLSRTADATTKTMIKSYIASLTNQ